MKKQAKAGTIKRKKRRHGKLYRQWSFLYRKPAKIALLAFIVFLAFIMRFSSSQCLSSHMFLGDDEYWHLHVLNQMVKVGHRPQFDFQAWAPRGREMVHPPIYHYLLYYVWKLFRGSVSTFDVMFWIGPFISMLGVIGWFLLCRALYGNSWFAGLVGASVYTVFPLTVEATAVGAARPEALAEAFMPLVLWVFLKGYKYKRKVFYVLPGVGFGLLSLIWGSSILLYFPLIIIFWIINLSTNNASKRLHIYCLATLSITLSITMWHFLPIYLKYGIWENTPSYLLSCTKTFFRPSLTSVLLDYTLQFNVFLFSALLSYFLMLLSTPENIKSDFPALWFMTLGLLNMCFLGVRVTISTLPFGILLCFTSLCWRVYLNKTLIPSFEWRLYFYGSLCLIMILSGFCTFHFLIPRFSPHYSKHNFSSITQVDIPDNSTVICWIGDSAFLLSHNLRTPWDYFMEYLPPWAEQQARKVMAIYMCESEVEAIQLMKEFNASYILVRIELAFPGRFKYFLESQGLNDNPQSYFTVSVAEPHYSKGFRVSPTEKGSEILIGRLIWNFQTGYQIPYLEHFMLVWKSEDGNVLLYKVREE